MDSGIQLDALSLVLNDAEGEVEILEISVLEPSPTSSAPIGRWDLEKITDIDTSAGVAMSVTKLDTDSVDLPAEVVAWAEPAAVTSTGEVLRSIGDRPSLLPKTAGGTWGALLPMQITPTANFGTILRSGTSPVEPVVLREGEGVALLQNGNSIPHASTCFFVVKVAGGGSYLLRSRDFGSRRSGLPLYAIFNGVGSGVVLEIHRWHMSEDGDTYIPGIRVTRIEGYLDPQESAEVGSALKMDPSGPDLPSGVKCVRGAALTQLVGTKAGVLYDWYIGNPSNTTVTLENLPATAPTATIGTSFTLQQQAGSYRAVTRVARLNALALACQTPDPGSLLWKAKSGAGILLKKGQGIAVAVGRGGVVDSSQLNFYDVRILFTYRAASKFAVLGNTRIVRALP